MNFRLSGFSRLHNISLVRTRLYSTVFKKDITLVKPKTYYVTTPIFYVNASPHIGHLHSMVLADTIKRWNELDNIKNPSSYLTTGTDEHGLKVQQASQAAKTDTKKFVDAASERFKSLASKAEISCDRFIRTTDPDHISSSCLMWKLLESKGFIYKGQHSGWYSVSDETFYPESQIEQKVLENGDKVHVSSETGKVVEWCSEENYFFALSKLQPKLLEYVEQNKDFIYPPTQYQNILQEIKSGLNDISISRPSSRCSWGIPVPGSEDSQNMYVWLDALTNYLTSAGFPWDKDIGQGNNMWPADVHVIGKDIVKFHTIYWPGFLLAADLPLPKHVVVHAHWTMKGSKMSKSVGNVVDPFETIDTFGVDSVKFFLMNDSFLYRDSDFSIERVAQRHNTELVNKYGNLVSRVCGKVFNINRALSRPASSFSNTGLIQQMNELSPKVQVLMKEFNTSSALSEIWSVIAQANTYVQDSQPWAVKDDLEKQDSIIKDVTEVSRVCSILLQPFIPNISKMMLDRLGVDSEKRGIEYAVYDADKTYGVGVNKKAPHPIKPVDLE